MPPAADPHGTRRRFGDFHQPHRAGKRLLISRFVFSRRRALHRHIQSIFFAKEGPARQDRASLDYFL